MKNISALIIFLFVFLNSTGAQIITRVADMPEPVTNQAVTFAEVAGQGFVYSFAGLDQSKLYSGIHQKGFKYSIANDTWESIDPLPSGNGRIAAGASFVKDKIYIIGGYEVFEDDSEISVDLVHVYDPATDTYLADATPIPVPIDDHIQAVWRDSLIYVVTGWSNTTNVPDVQIYNPSNDEWSVGTPVPDNSTYKVFGSSGVIVGDTIYYSGGVRIAGGAFASSNVIRKGIINPDNPMEIDWSHRVSIDAIGYRMGAASWEGQIPLWIGGSRDAYNFDGISFNTGLGVEPYGRILQLDPVTDNLDENFVDFPIMDNREVAQIGPTSILVCGGIGIGQVVSNSTYLIDVNFVNVENLNNSTSNRYVFPSPTNDQIYLFNGIEGAFYEIINVMGQLVKKGVYQKDGISLNSLETGYYFLNLIDSRNRVIRFGGFTKM